MIKGEESETQRERGENFEIILERFHHPNDDRNRERLFN